jgi:hypothetical protein
LNFLDTVLEKIQDLSNGAADINSVVSDVNSPLKKISLNIISHQYFNQRIKKLSFTYLYDLSYPKAYAAFEDAMKNNFLSSEALMLEEQQTGTHQGVSLTEHSLLDFSKASNTNGKN